MAEFTPHLDPKWNSVERVARFAARAPDIHLRALIADWQAHTGRPFSGARVLDLGCAAGRNFAPVLQAGGDVFALDAAPAMVACARARLAGLAPDCDPSARVVQGFMHAPPFAERTFDLAIALGVLHMAQSDDEARAVLAELRRVLRSGGLLLLSTFARAMLPDGAVPRAGESATYDTEFGPQFRPAAPLLERFTKDAGLVLIRPFERREGTMSDSGRPRISHLGVLRRVS